MADIKSFECSKSLLYPKDRPSIEMSVRALDLKKVSSFPYQAVLIFILASDTLDRWSFCACSIYSNSKGDFLKEAPNTALHY